MPTLTPGRRPKAPPARSGNTMTFVDRALIKSFMERFEELASGAVAIGALAVADRSGLLRAMAGRGPVTVEELAVDEKGDDRFTPRYLEEILATLAGAGVVSYDPDTERFHLADEHAACLADPASPYSMAGWLDMIPAALGSVDRVTRATVEGGGIPLDDFDERIVAGIDRLNSPGTRILLTKRWLAAMPDVVAKLEEGARIADVGCGSGTAALVMAAAFPASTVVGYDIDPRAIARAHDRAAESELANISFELIPAADLPGEFDLVTTFDVIHDLADPVEALSRIFTALSDRGHLSDGGTGRRGLAGRQPQSSRRPHHRFFASLLPAAVAGRPRSGVGSGVGSAASRASCAARSGSHASNSCRSKIPTATFSGSRDDR